MKILLCIAAALAVTGCALSVSKPAPQSELPKVERFRAIYYWKSAFTMNAAEQQFLTDHKIGRLYLRYFDVYIDENEDVVPNATVAFRDSLPVGIDVVPTVFIDNAIFKLSDYPTDLAQNIVNRIEKMSKTNNVSNIKQVQIDCDWTLTTEQIYFHFLSEVRAMLKEKKVQLSVTIRLHQLSMSAPDVDCGVLMCYNTGSVKNHTTENSILRAADVKPYAKHIAGYKLHLDVGYPTFDWAVWFSDGQFQALLRGADRNISNLEYKNGNVYTVKNGYNQEGHYLASGDEVRFEESCFSEIIHTKEMVESQLTDYSTIIYHLDSANLSKYSYDEISEIYNF